MQFLAEFDIKTGRQHVVAVLISAVLHLVFLAAILSSPFFRTRTIVPTDFVDVMLFEYAMPGLEADILPGGQQPADKKPPEKPKVEKKSELVDPSEAELKRMKRRLENRTPPPDTSQNDEFSMQNGILPGGGGQTMGSMRIDAKDFPFMYYLSMLKNRVSENWIPPFGSFEAEHKRAVISFRIDRTGNLVSSGISESSGDTLLDQSALRAVIVSAPFPPLPEGYNDASLGVHFGFICKL